MARHYGHKPKGQKQHAQVRNEPRRARPLWVWDAEDWKLMQTMAEGQLVCPHPACTTSFTKPIENKHGTRFLRDMPGASCSHYLPREHGEGGGPVSAQHRWLQGRLARICELLGYDVFPEHPETNSDVFVETARFAIEVQRWTTKFEERTRKREQVEGVRVLWLLTEDLNSRRANSALFTLPAARIRVHARDDHSKRLAPWLNPTEEKQAILSVYATVATLHRETCRLGTGFFDAYKFLKEILSGHRRWHPPGTPGLPKPRAGAWVLDEDMERIRNPRPRGRETPIAPPGSLHLAQQSTRAVSITESNSETAHRQGDRDAPIQAPDTHTHPPQLAAYTVEKPSTDNNNAATTQLTSTSPGANSPWHRLLCRLNRLFRRKQSG